jgi:hypothetical protein
MNSCAKRWIAVNVTGITILCHQLECDLLTIASNQQGNMGLPVSPFSSRLIR